MYRHLTPALKVASRDFIAVDLFEELRRERVFVDLPKPALAEIFSKVGASPATLAGKLGIEVRNLQRYRGMTRSTPLGVLKELLKMSGIHSSALQGRIRMRIGNTGTPIFVGPMLMMDSEFVYVAELIRCDGHIPRSLWYTVFVNKEERLILSVERFFRKFGFTRKNMSLSSVNGVNYLRVHSRLLATILHKVYGIPLGKKGDMRAPKLVLDSPVLASSMVRAAFDAEGNVQSRDALQKSTPRRIVITNTSRRYLKCVKLALWRFGIESRIYYEARSQRPILRLVVYGQERIRNFLKYVKPNHPEKQQKLKFLLSTYQKNRAPELSLRPKILGSMSAGNNTRRKIANDLGLSLAQVGNQLYRIRKLKLVTKPKLAYSNHGRLGVYRLSAKGKLLLKRPIHADFQGDEPHR